VQSLGVAHFNTASLFQSGRLLGRVRAVLRGVEIESRGWI
jgi:hypothetical protein